MEDMLWQLLLGLAQCPAAPSGERGGALKSGAGEAAVRELRSESYAAALLLIEDFNQEFLLLRRCVI